jgi:DNA-binding transcriptional LysR family regulator
MTLTQLKTFETVAKHQNLSHASAELHVSQSSITQTLKHLEEEFKTKLYRKRPRGIVLTEEGEKFLRHTRAILDEVHKVAREFSGTYDSKEPTALRVGGSFAPSASFLPRILAELRRDDPSIRLVLKTHDSATLERMLLKRELDLAVLNHRPESEGMVSKPYGTETLAVFASANHPIGKQRRLTLGELARVPVVIRDAKGSQTLIERLLRKAEIGIRPNIVLRCESPAAVKTAVKNRMGVGILFLSSVKAEIQSGKFRRLIVSGAELNIQTHIVYRRDSLTPTVSRFIDILYRLRGSR